MVSNSSSLGEDLSQIGSAIGGAATDIGQFVGLVDDDLIPGDAAETGELAAHLSKLGDATGRAGEGFKKIDTGSWHGQAADAARDYINTASPQWLKASDCFTSAGRAVAEYQRVLAESQQKAARAKADLERAQQASDAAREAYNARVDAYNAAAQQASNNGGPPPTPPGKFHDPAAGDIAAADQDIKQAQKAVEDAGNRAAQAVLEATHGAPAEPGLLTQFKENAVDSVQAAGRTIGALGAGAVGAVVDLGKLARTITPLDPYNITHPAQFTENMATLTTGVVGAAQDPYGAIKTSVDVDGWKRGDPRVMGACIPDAIASLAGGAGVASRVSRTVGKLADNADDLGRGATHADELPRNGLRDRWPEPQNPATLHSQPDLPMSQHVPAAPQHLGPQWGSWPEPSHPNVPAAHPEPSTSPQAPADRGLDAAGDPYQPPTQRDGFVRPSEMTAPGSHHSEVSPEIPLGRDVTGPNVRPELHDSHGSNQLAPPGSSSGYDAPEQRGYQRLAPHERFADELDPWDDVEGGRVQDRSEHSLQPETPNSPDAHPDPESLGRDQDRPREDPTSQGSDGPAQDLDPRTPDHDPNQDLPRHELADDDRQAYRERIEQRLGGDFDEHVARLRAEHPELAHLDDEKAMGLRRYIGEDANTINRILREGDAVDRDYLRPEFNVLRSALDEMPKVDTTDTPRVFRDIGVADKDLPALLERYKPGAEVEEPAFTSASKDIPPSHFAEHGAEKDRVVRFIIDDPKHARDLSGTNPDELEVAWQDGNRFLVQGIQQVGDEVHIHTRDLGR